MYECPKGCESQRFVQKIEQPKWSEVNERGEAIKVHKIDEPTVSEPRCKTCGAEVEA